MKSTQVNTKIILKNTNLFAIPILQRLTAFTVILLQGSVLSAQIDTTSNQRADSAKLLNTVTVSNSVSSKILRQQPGNVSVIEARPFYNTNVTANDLLRQTSGIKVKQDGGYGSRTSFLINGSTGKQVKFFIDGLPQDNLGETRGLNIFPVEQLERIEVYKGVLPVDLGADALGAAINLVTRKEKEDYIDASFAHGSFGTARFNLLGKKYLSNHLFVALQSSINFAKNNYAVDVEIPDSSGNPKALTVRRFHDDYRNYNVKGDVGFTSLRWADALTFSIVHASLFDELQHNLVMQQPYGKATYNEQLYSAILKYSKAELFKNFNLSAFASYNRINGLFNDTSRNVYTWDGAVYDRRISGGEISSSANRLQLFSDVANAKLTASYRLSSRHRLIFSNTFQHYLRTGRDTVAQKFYGGRDYFGNPSLLQKNISGLSLDGSYAGGRLKISTAIKQYHAKIKGFTIEWTTLLPSGQMLTAVAYNAALAYKLKEALLLKVSYEKAARLPEAEEAFGDLMLIKPNPSITTEKSHNINAGVLYNTKKWDAELSSFFRAVGNIIYLRSTQFFSTYQNLLSANVSGVEGAVRFYPTTRLTINANATYQSLRNRSIIDNSTINNERYKGARIPNVPYLCVNGGVVYTKDDVIKKSTALHLWWNTAYTHEYFLYWEVDGARELKNRIPTQWLQYAGVSYNIKKSGSSISFEVNNVFNQTTYDNFKVQLPGRSYSIKLRFYQSKNKHQ